MLLSFLIVLVSTLYVEYGLLFIAFATLMGGVIVTWTKLNNTISVLNTRLDNLEKLTNTLQNHIDEDRAKIVESMLQLSNTATSVDGKLHVITHHIESLSRRLDIHSEKIENLRDKKQDK